MADLSVDLKRRAEFMQELQTLINRYGVDTDADTQDFVLAEYVLGCLSIYGLTVKKRDQLTGRH